MIIGICGLIGSGKDSIASYLEETHNFTRLNFSAKLKEACAIIFDWDIDMLNGLTKAARDQRELVDDWWSEKLGIDDLSPRKALQLIGTEVFRQNFSDNIWVAAVERTITKHQHVILSDVRFPNEIAMIRNVGGQMWRVSRKEMPDWYTYIMANEHETIADYMKTYHPDVHPSEWSWIRESFDQDLANRGTLDDLYQAAADLLPRDVICQ